MAAQQHHIPLLFMADVINGYKTIFPIPLAQGCSFNPDMVKKLQEYLQKNQPPPDFI